MPTAVLTPFVSTPALQSGRLWRKRLLPVGEIGYQGRTLRFTREYNDGLAAAFASGAYDQVPFQLADAGNSHTNDPERYRGDIVAMDSRPDGLWITLAPTTDGEETILRNPRLGVSARIVEDYARSDGKFYPQAVQHVLGTLDPRITGLGAWEPVEMSSQPDRVIDLTGLMFTGEAEGTGGMPELTDEQRAKMLKLLDIPDDKFDELIAGLAAPGLTDAELAEITGDGGDTELTDDELNELVNAATELDAAGQLEPAGAGLSNNSEALLAIELANARADDNDRQLREVRQHLDEQQFLAERDRLASDCGVPPFITDLARPLLEGAGHVVELANGQPVDAGAIIRQVLTEYGKAVRLLDLSTETGSVLDGGDGTGADDTAKARDELVGRYKQLTGIR